MNEVRLSCKKGRFEFVEYFFYSNEPIQDVPQWEDDWEGPDSLLRGELWGGYEHVMVPEDSVEISIDGKGITRSSDIDGLNQLPKLERLYINGARIAKK